MFQVGDIVWIKPWKDGKRPSTWNDEGKMDKYVKQCVKVVTSTSSQFEIDSEGAFHCNWIFDNHDAQLAVEVQTGNLPNTYLQSLPEFNLGDIVRIKSFPDDVKPVGWIEEMRAYYGQTGKISLLYGSAVYRVRLPIERSYSFRADSIELETPVKSSQSQSIFDEATHIGVAKKDSPLGLVIRTGEVCFIKFTDSINYRVHISNTTSPYVYVGILKTTMQDDENFFFISKPEFRRFFTTYTEDCLKRGERIVINLKEARITVDHCFHRWREWKLKERTAIPDEPVRTTAEQNCDSSKKDNPITYVLSTKPDLTELDTKSRAKLRLKHLT